MVLIASRRSSFPVTVGKPRCKATSRVLRQGVVQILAATKRRRCVSASWARVRARSHPQMGNPKVAPAKDYLGNLRLVGPSGVSNFLIFSG